VKSFGLTIPSFLPSFSGSSRRHALYKEFKSAPLLIFVVVFILTFKNREI
jgi:hypothetical protein